MALASCCYNQVIGCMSYLKITADLKIKSHFWNRGGKYTQKHEFKAKILFWCVLISVIFTVEKP